MAEKTLCGDDSGQGRNSGSNSLIFGSDNLLPVSCNIHSAKYDRFGTAAWPRTTDLLTHNQALYRLSFGNVLPAGLAGPKLGRRGLLAHNVNLARGFATTAGWPILVGQHHRPYFLMSAMNLCSGPKRQVSCKASNWTPV